MSQRILASFGATTVVIAVAFLASIPEAGKAQTAAKDWTAPRTPEGHPDLQGIWDYATMVPLERPAEFAGRLSITSDEAAALEAQILKRLETGAVTERMPTGTYDLFWREPGKMSTRTSLIVDPPDGKIPPLTPDGQKKAIALSARGERFDSYKDRPLSDRCLAWMTAGPPMMPGPYNSIVQIVQAPGYVVLLNEMIHDHRIIPLNGRPHLPRDIRQWMGDSRGRWEGATFVVVTTNYSPEANFQLTGNALGGPRGSAANMHLVERFTRVDADTIAYEFTVTDPQTFSRPWTAAFSMKKARGPLFEYACHEENYALVNSLSGARKLERAAANKE